MSVDIWQKSLRMGGETLNLEIGRVACQAGGSLLLSAGRAVILVTAVARPEPTPNAGFFPLTVDYREKMAGAGRIPGGFLRREARATTTETLTSRIIDRSIRPFFPEGFRCETQVLANVLSHDPEVDATVLALTGASAALTLSEIPWGGPLAGVRIARIDGELRTFPTASERAHADLDLVVTVSHAGLVMVEGRADEVPEEVLLEALDLATAGAAPFLEVQAHVREARGAEKRIFESPVPNEDLAARDRSALSPGIEALFGPFEKKRRNQLRADLRTEILAALPEDPEADPPAVSRETITADAIRAEIRARALKGQRLDGRGPTDVRSISGEVGWLPSAHGSSIFTRGETQALVTCTLGSVQDEQMVESLAGIHKESFMLHYNFPPFSVGEVRPMRGPGRREIGHGALARRALRGMLPATESFPFTIRLESDIASSNGSSSMATVCGGTLALLDAGVPIRRPVAGVAMGLIVAGDERVILTDILGDEDHLGDMDFKVAGTEEGITAVQMDNKVGSLPRETLRAALEQARSARLTILAEMARILPGARAEIARHIPQVRFRQIRPVRIRDLIGPGGRHIQGVQSETGVKIDVDEEGRVKIFGPPGAKLREAEERVHYLTGEPVVGGIYRGRVTNVLDFGCFVELFQGIEGLVHVTQLDEERVEHPSDIAKPGDEMLVKVLGTTADGKIELSRREALGADPTEI